jgi:hypothetical protein
MKKKLTALLISFIAGVTLVACSEADTVSRNLSKSADSFDVERRVVFFNGITDEYLLTIEGRCSLGNSDHERQLSVTCKVSEGDEEDAYKKHFLGLSDNVSFFVEQLESNNEDPFRYKVLFRPESIVPDIEMQHSGQED